jgi:hypothetical protein
MLASNYGNLDRGVAAIAGPALRGGSIARKRRRTVETAGVHFKIDTMIHGAVNLFPRSAPPMPISTK